MNYDRDSNGQLLFGGRELLEGETSVMPPIGWAAQFIDALPLNNFAQLMINLCKNQRQDKKPIPTGVLTPEQLVNGIG